MISHAQILSLAAEMDPFSVGAWVGGMSEPIDNLKFQLNSFNYKKVEVSDLVNISGVGGGHLGQREAPVRRELGLH